jgi:hypothetical protein
MTSCGNRRIVADGTKIRSSQNVRIKGYEAEVDLRGAEKITAGKDVEVCSDKGDIYLPRGTFGGGRNTTVSGRCD